MNHARRLADNDWTGAESDEEVEEKQNSQQQDETEDEGMEVEQRKKLPKHYANQVITGTGGLVPFLFVLFDLFMFYRIER